MADTNAIPGYNRVFQKMRFLGPDILSICEYTTEVNDFFIASSSQQTFTNPRLWLANSLVFVPAGAGRQNETYNSLIVSFTSYAKPLSIPLYNGTYSEYINNNEMAAVYQARGLNLTEVSFVEPPYLQNDASPSEGGGISDGGITAIVLGGLMVAGFAGFLANELGTTGAAAAAA